jgi:uncharacterized Zn-finger protein
MMKLSHSNVTFVTKSCSTKDNMKKHVASVHEGKKPFRCDICEYRSSEKSNMNRHIKSVHEGKKNLKFEYCAAGFVHMLPKTTYFISS